MKLRQYSGEDREHVVSRPFDVDGIPSSDGWGPAEGWATVQLPPSAETDTEGDVGAAANTGSQARQFVLYTAEGYPERIHVLEVPACSELRPIHSQDGTAIASPPQGAEVFVLQGSVTVTQQDGTAFWQLHQHSWLRLPPVLAECTIRNESSTPAYIYYKANHLQNHTHA